MEPHELPVFGSTFTSAIWSFSKDSSYGHILSVHSHMREENGNTKFHPFCLPMIPAGICGENISLKCDVGFVGGVCVKESVAVSLCVCYKLNFFCSTFSLVSATVWQWFCLLTFDESISVILNSHLLPALDGLLSVFALYNIKYTYSFNTRTVSAASKTPLTLTLLF